MPDSPKSNLLSTTKIAVGVIAMTVLMLGVLLLVQGLIDTRDYRSSILQAIKAETGRDATIKGKVSLWLLPLPTIYVPNVELHGAQDDAPSLSVEMMKLSVPAAALFSSHLRVSAINLQNPRLSLSRGDDHRIRWGWLTPDLIKKLMGAGAGGREPLAITLKDGSVTYHDDSGDKSITAGNVNATISAGDTLTIDSDCMLGGHVLRADIRTRPASGPATPLAFDFYTDGNHAVSWKGTIDLSGHAPKLAGKMTFSVDDTLALVQAQSPENPLNRIPLSLSGDWSQEGWNVTLDQLQLTGLSSEGTGKVTLTWKGWQPSLAVDAHFKTFDYDAWKMLISAAFPLSAPAAAGMQADKGNPLPADMNISLHLAADALTAGTQSWKNVSLVAELADQSFTINQFNAALPGNTNFTLFGIISQGATGGLRFDGNTTTDGQSLKEMLTAFDSSASGLPEAGFGVFHINSNLFISAEQLRLSEADVKLGDLHLNGGLVDYFDAQRPRIEADIKLKDIDFDYFRDVWRARQQKKAGAPVEDVLSIDRSKGFGWLKRLQTTVDFKVSVDGFTFLDHKGSDATFRLFAREGEVGLYDIRLHYPDGTTEASFNMKVNGDQPAVNVMLNTKEFNTNYFSADPAAEVIAPPPAPDSKKTWSTALIDMGWMDGWGGRFDLSIDKLTHGALTLDNFKSQAKLDNNLLNLQNCSFLHWQGRWSVTGAVYGGAVPGIAVSFTLFNGELHDILHSLIGRDNVSGRLSVSGTLSTSGVNALSWVSQADAKLVTAARGVQVKGINLQGVVHAVSVSRTSADVFNNVNRALVNGSTMFDVDGNINVKDGVMGTPGMTLKSDTIVGNLTGNVKLVPWTMDLTTLFQFPAMTSDTVPTMTVQLAGHVSAAALKTDTSSLEAYVTKRITSN